MNVRIANVAVAWTSDVRSPFDFARRKKDSQSKIVTMMYGDVLDAR
jgi:hypothetical protein